MYLNEIQCDSCHKLVKDYTKKTFTNSGVFDECFTLTYEGKAYEFQLPFSEIAEKTKRHFCSVSCLNQFIKKYVKD